MFIRKDKKIQSFVHGGPQERSMRGGTENVYGIIGLAKALEIAYQNLGEHKLYITRLKARMIEKLKASIPGVEFHGSSANLDKSLYTVLNVCLPESDEKPCCFSISICTEFQPPAEAPVPAAHYRCHVLGALYPDSKKGAVRFSFSKYNTEEEVDYAVTKLAELYKITA